MTQPLPARMEPVPFEELRRPRTNVVTAADIAGVTIRTMYRWIRLGRVEVCRTAGGEIRVFTDTLLRREIDTDD